MFQRTTENHFGKQNHYFMKELSIHNEYLKNSVLAPNHITVNYLHFALISMEIEIIDSFQIKPYKNNYAVPLLPDRVLWKR